MDNFTFSMILLAAVMHASWNFFTKKTKRDRFALLWIAHLYIMFFTIPIIPQGLFGLTLEYNLLICIIFTAIVHSLYIITLGWAYRIGEISFIYPISRGVGILGASIGSCMLGIDSLSYLGVIGVCIIVLGVIILGNSQYKNASKHAFIGAVTLGLLTASYSVIDRIGVNYIDPLSYCSIMFFVTGVMLSFYVLIMRRDLVKDLKYQYFRDGGFLGTTMFITYIIVLHAFEQSPVAYVVALREISVAIAATLGIVILKESMSMQKILGIFILLLGAVAIKLV